MKVPENSQVHTQSVSPNCMGPTINFSAGLLLLGKVYAWTRGSRKDSLPGFFGSEQERNGGWE